MAKNFKFNIKNTQIAKAINLGSVKDKLEKKKAQAKSTKDPESPKKAAKVLKKDKVKEKEIETEELTAEEAPKIKARSRSAFDPSQVEESSKTEIEPEEVPETIIEEPEQLEEEVIEAIEEVEETPIVEDAPVQEPVKEEIQETKPVEKPPLRIKPEKLGPTGRHVKDLLPKARPASETAASKGGKRPQDTSSSSKDKPKVKGQERSTESEEQAKKNKSARFKEFRDIKPTPRRQEPSRPFDARARHGFRDIDDSGTQWRKKRQFKSKQLKDDNVPDRPKSLKIRLPITIKDLASEMKLKASQLISKLFMQGLVVTLNDYLEDETVVQLLGHEFECEITIDTTEAERIRITDKTIKEEIADTPSELFVSRPPVVTFMGHVDHGKTSLIDYIRKTNVASGEAGAITQHIGAFCCHTAVGDISFLDTPGHEAFSAMRARGADVTDIVVLVVAGDEGIKQQTIEAINHAKTAGVTIVVAINKCDKPNFDPQDVYRQLSEQELLPEPWGGQTITVNCSAVTGEGISELLEMLALQAEVLELKANPSNRARGSVLESEMHKGLGSVATVLVQNGTLRIGDALVFEEYWGKVKTMRDEHGKDIVEAKPSTPVAITGLSGLPEAGQEFIAVKDEKEARDISVVRMAGIKQNRLQQAKKFTMESLIEEAEAAKKVLNVVLRADVQGSLEALQLALMNIKSDKVELNILSSEVGDITESDVQLAAPAKAVIIGFHTQVESHADELIRQLSVTVKNFDVIYHAIDDVKQLMTDRLDKLAKEVEKGKAEIRAIFKSSQLGLIAGCYVTEGTIHRNHHIRVKRNGEEIWKGSLSSLKRVKEDVKEVQKGVECGIVLSNFKEIEEGDIIESYEITYIAQEL